MVIFKPTERSLIDLNQTARSQISWKPPERSQISLKPTERNLIDFKSTWKPFRDLKSRERERLVDLRSVQRSLISPLVPERTPMTILFKSTSGVYSSLIFYALLKPKLSPESSVSQLSGEKIQTEISWKINFWWFYLLKSQKNCTLLRALLKIKFFKAYNFKTVRDILKIPKDLKSAWPWLSFDKKFKNQFKNKHALLTKIKIKKIPYFCSKKMISLWKFRFSCFPSNYSF